MLACYIVRIVCQFFIPSFFLGLRIIRRHLRAYALLQNNAALALIIILQLTSYDLDVAMYMIQHAMMLEQSLLKETDTSGARACWCARPDVILQILCKLALAFVFLVRRSRAKVLLVHITQRIVTFAHSVDCRY